MSDLYDIVKGLFDIDQKNSSIQLSFIDDEDDCISFSTDRELNAAFALVQSEGWNTFKINVHVGGEEEKSLEHVGAKSASLLRRETAEKSAMETKSLQNRNESIVAEEKAAQVEVSSKPKASFVQNMDAPVRGADKSGSNNGDKAEGNVAISSSKKEETTFQSVPLRATSGGAYIYRDGTVEFGMGGE